MSRLRLSVVVFAAFLLAACDSSHAPQDTADVDMQNSQPGSPLSPQPSQALRVVSLTPGITELMYAVGAEQLLVATVEFSDYPEAARQVPRIGDAFRVDPERLLALKPDLVLAGGTLTPDGVKRQVQSLGLRMEMVESRQLSDIGAALLRVGDLTGHQAQAQQAVQLFKQGVADLQQRYASREPLSVFIEVNRQPLYTVNGGHIINEVVQSCGGSNVFAALNQLAPVVGIEAVLKADPQVILALDGSQQQVSDDWAKWPQLGAVRRQRLYAVSPDTTTRATPRLLEGMQAVCEALDAARKR